MTRYLGTAAPGHLVRRSQRRLPPTTLMGGERGPEKPRGAGGALSPAARRQQRQRDRREKLAREKKAGASKKKASAAAGAGGAASKRPPAGGSARGEVKRARRESSSGSEDDVGDDSVDESGDDAKGPGAAGGDDDAVERTGAYGSYGRTDGRMSVEDDEWATAPRTWAALAPYLSDYHDKKIWAPFYYDGAAGKRLRDAGFTRVVHKREDFFKRINDRVFVKSVSAVVDNPPYTGKGMKERVLRALVDADVPFCLLLPLGVLHTATVREILDPEHVQALIPRRCWVSKSGQREVPFKYLVWLCYKMRLPRDLVLMPDT